MGEEIIRGRLEDKLKLLEPEDCINVIITGKSQGDAQNIIDYLNNHGINENGRSDILKRVSTNLNKKQIYDLAEQPYVDIILEDKKDD